MMWSKEKWAWVLHSTGREVRANGGCLSLSVTGGMREGCDGVVWADGENQYVATGDPATFAPAERAEIAEEMCRRWNAWAMRY